MSSLTKRVKQVAFGFRRFRNYRIRAPLHAGKPNWDLLATVTPLMSDAPPNAVAHTEKGLGNRGKRIGTESL
jgi:hypothetical protein